MRFRLLYEATNPLSYQFSPRKKSRISFCVAHVEWPFLRRCFYQRAWCAIFFAFGRPFGASTLSKINDNRSYWRTLTRHKNCPPYFTLVRLLVFCSTPHIMRCLCDSHTFLSLLAHTKLIRCQRQAAGTKQMRQMHSSWQWLCSCGDTPNAEWNERRRCRIGALSRAVTHAPRRFGHASGEKGQKTFQGNGDGKACDMRHAEGTNEQSKSVMEFFVGAEHERLSLGFCCFFFFYYEEMYGNFGVLPCPMYYVRMEWF